MRLRNIDLPKLWYSMRYDLKSLLWITYRYCFLTVPIALFISNGTNRSIPHIIEQTRVLSIIIPWAIIMFYIIIMTIHWLVFIIMSIFKIDYANGKICSIIEIGFKYVFPKKLYVNTWLKVFWFWTNDKSTIYYWVVFNIFILIAICVSLWFLYLPNAISTIEKNWNKLVQLIPYLQSIQK